MTIGIVTPCVRPGDGQGRANYEIVKYALQQGASIRIIAHELADDLKGSVEFFPAGVPGLLDKTDLTRLLHLASFANKTLRSWTTRPDVLHSYGYCTDLPHDLNTSQFVHSAWVRSPFHTAKINKNLYGLYQNTYTHFNIKKEHESYHRARLVVAASQTVYQELHELVHIPKERLRVINNGADTAEFHPLADGEQADRAGLKLPEGVVLGLFAGDIRTPRKNLDSVLKAMAKVEGFELAVVGRLEGSPFPALAEQLGISKRVHFLDFRRDVAAIMRACDFFIFPSRYEACSLVLSEATASGLPVITARTTGGAEVIPEGGGILVENPDDIAALEGALRTLIQDPAQRQAMAAIARARYRDQAWDRICIAYYAIYRELAETKS
jgi:glycosyltransferase involved in cell wall biosynthesis